MKRTVLPEFSDVRGQHLLVALSGGADSVALTCMLAERRSTEQLRLSAAHIDHCIRGEESRRDAAFCRDLCRRLDIPFYFEETDVPAAAKATGEGIETAARRLRYEALRRIAGCIGADRIATAHHMNDQAETVLMHLLRGCGPEGIAGMQVLSGDLYRPLLNTPRSALEAWLTARGQPWCTDSTNSEAFTPRNALRLHGLPALEESYPQAVQAIARYADAAACEDRLMARMTREFLDARLETGPYGCRLMNPGQADEAILRRAVRSLCGSKISHEKLKEITALARCFRGKAEISKAEMAEKTPDALYFLRKTPDLPPPLPLPALGCAEWQGIGKMEVARGAPVPVRDNPLKQVLRADALENAQIRTRREGDRIRPLGCGDRLLSDYFTDRKIDRPLRDFIPLVAKGSRVLWAVGVGISEDAALKSEQDIALCLEWTWQ